MTTAFDALKAAAAATPAVAENTAQLPRLGWRNGAKQVKQPGFFYIKADDVGLDEPDPATWTEKSVYGDELGFIAERAEIAYLGHRMQPFRKEDGGGQYPLTIWLDKWEPGAQFYTEALCMVKGAGGPFVWTMKGLTGKAVTGKGGITDQAAKFVKAAGAAVGSALNPWAFWLPISTQVDGRGQVVYQDTGFKSTTTPPALYLPNGDIQSQASALFVGDQYAAFTAVYQDYKRQGWFAQRRGNAPAAAPAVAEEPAASFTPAYEGDTFDY